MKKYLVIVMLASSLTAGISYGNDGPGSNGQPAQDPIFKIIKTSPEASQAWSFEVHDKKSDAKKDEASFLTGWKNAFSAPGGLKESDYNVTTEIDPVTSSKQAYQGAGCNYNAKGQANWCTDGYSYTKDYTSYQASVTIEVSNPGYSMADVSYEVDNANCAQVDKILDDPAKISKLGFVAVLRVATSAADGVGDDDYCQTDDKGNSTGDLVVILAR